MKNENSKQMILSVIGVFSLILLVIGVSFAFFNYAGEGTTANVITAGTITFSYSDATAKGNGINLTNEMPRSDADGMALIGDNNIFNFTILANTKAAAVNYEIVATKLDKSTLAEDKVKIYLTDVTLGKDAPVGKTYVDNKVVKYNTLKETLLDKRIGKTLFDEVILKGIENYKRDFRLRMWLSEDVDMSLPENHNKVFSIKINVYANLGIKNKPIIKLNGNNPTNISVGKTYTELGATAKDWKETSLTPTITGTVNTNTVGEYIITYKVIDSLESETTMTRTVFVRDIPSITLKGSNEINIPLNATYKDEGVIGKDWDNKPLSSTTTGNVDTTKVGTYTLTYTVTDSLGGVNSITRTVNVRNLPTISLYGNNPYEMFQGETYSEAGYIGRDWNNQVLTASISGFINSNVVGTYTLTYTVTDSLGGSSAVNRTVNVKTIILRDALVTNLGANGTVYEPVAGGTKYIRSAKGDTAPHLVN
ncbi:MAG: DUF5011 domain-containing protein, partial [Bacilli bacterium]